MVFVEDVRNGKNMIHKFKNVSVPANYIKFIHLLNISVFVIKDTILFKGDAANVILVIPTTK